MVNVYKMDMNALSFFPLMLFLFVRCAVSLVVIVEQIV